MSSQLNLSVKSLLSEYYKKTKQQKPDGKDDEDANKLFQSLAYFLGSEEYFDKFSQSEIMAGTDKNIRMHLLKQWDKKNERQAVAKSTKLTRQRRYLVTALQLHPPK
ncbi:hypothetical protein DHEL01_v211787 [Diaporthe helianthi]|uniref:Uncharacterized protein n=1 Tax=Diaporthe helianthi TaxID=158607 RepID=A0A2P5HHU8_DIAHE|nr:hypothetical protein DHEL01_v211787 [Diaporthe helianthi]